MSGCRRLGVGAPQILFLDARSDGLDEAGLRRRAREAVGDARCSSRSYRYPFALVGSHDAAIGVDVERLMPFDAAFADYICTPREHDRLCRAADRGEFLTSLWAGKEALAKALGDALVYEPSRLEAPELWPNGTAGRWRAERVPAPDGHVAWVCWTSLTDPGA